MRSTPVTAQIPDFSLLIRELERCGWKRGRMGPLEGELFFQTAHGGLRAPTLAMQTDAGETLLIIDFSEFELSGRDELFPRFLDFPMETRMALGAAGLVARAERVLLRGAEQIELYRLPDETQEYRATSARDFEDELLPILAARTRPKPDVPRLAIPSQEGSQALRGWLAHWSRRIAGALDVSGDEAARFLWKLILMLQTARKAGKSEMLGGWGLVCEKLGGVWTLSYDSLETIADVARALDDFEHTFSTRHFPENAEQHKQWLARLDETSLVEQLRAELLMQTQVKFEAENVAWLFSQIDREQEGWRREVSGLAPVRKRFSFEGWQVIQPLECEVGRHGLSFALREFDRLAAHWNDYAALARAREAGAPTEPIATQPDLFRGMPRGISLRSQLDDGINFIFAESLRLTNVPPDEEFGVGVVMLLKALSVARRHEWPFLGIDTLDRALG